MKQGTRNKELETLLDYARSDQNTKPGTQNPEHKTQNNKLKNILFMQPREETQTNESKKIILQGRVGAIFDLTELGDRNYLVRFTLVIEVGMLDDNDNVQTEILTIIVNAFDDLALKVKSTLRINDEVLVMGTAAENNDEEQTSSKNQIIAQQFRIIPKEPVPEQTQKPQ